MLPITRMLLLLLLLEQCRGQLDRSWVQVRCWEAYAWALRRKGLIREHGLLWFQPACPQVLNLTGRKEGRGEAVSEMARETLNL